MRNGTDGRAWRLLPENEPGAAMVVLSNFDSLIYAEKHINIMGLVLTSRHPQSKLDCFGHIQSLWSRQVIAVQGLSQI